MAKSRNRGGAKAHRKRVQKRNVKLGIEQKKFQKVFNNMYKTRMEELEKSLQKLSGLTSNSELENTDEIQNISEEKTEVSSSESENSQSN